MTERNNAKNIDEFAATPTTKEKWSVQKNEIIKQIDCRSISSQNIALQLGTYVGMGDCV